MVTGWADGLVALKLKALQEWLGMLAYVELVLQRYTAEILTMDAVGAGVCKQGVVFSIKCEPRIADPARYTPDYCAESRMRIHLQSYRHNQGEGGRMRKPLASLQGVISCRCADV